MSKEVNLKKNLEFVNAQEQARLHPETFEAPSKAELDAIVEGSTVKVSIGGERFWNQVTKVDGSIITATVDNDLVCTKTHGLKYGDTITFVKDNIFMIYSK